MFILFFSFYLISTCRFNFLYFCFDAYFMPFLCEEFVCVQFPCKAFSDAFPVWRVWYKFMACYYFYQWYLWGAHMSCWFEISAVCQLSPSPQNKSNQENQKGNSDICMHSSAAGIIYSTSTWSPKSVVRLAGSANKTGACWRNSYWEICLFTRFLHLSPDTVTEFSQCSGSRWCLSKPPTQKENPIRFRSWFHTVQVFFGILAAPSESCPGWPTCLGLSWRYSFCHICHSVSGWKFI